MTVSVSYTSTGSIVSSRPASLPEVHRSWGCPPSDQIIEWLIEQGVSSDQMTMPYPVGEAMAHSHQRPE